MTTAFENHPLVIRIAALRRQARFLLGLHALGITLATLLGASLILSFADYCLHFAPALRLLLLIAFVLSLGVLAWRKAFLPLSRRLTDQFLASRVEQVNSGLTDELMGVVAFLRQGVTEKNALAAKALENVEQRTASMEFGDALDWRLTFRALGIAGLIAVVLGIIGAVNPAGARIAFARWSDPWGQHPWPKITTVEFDWPGGVPPAVHPLGDRLVLRAKVTPENERRTWVYYWSDTQRQVGELMTPQGAQGGVARFEKELDPVGEQRFYVRLVSGDDREMAPVEIRLAPRPIVTSLHALIAPPAYVRNISDPSKPVAAKSYDMLSESARAVEGSTVHLRVEASNVLGLTDKGEPNVYLMETSRDAVLSVEPMQRELVEGSSGKAADLTFPATKSLEFRMMVRDLNGFDNRVAGTVRLEVVPDALPMLVVTEPRRQLEVVPDAVLNVQMQGTDDLGLSAVYLQADNYDAKPGEPPRFRQGLEWGQQVADSGALSVSAKTQFTWELGKLGLKPGDRLSFYGLVRDNFALPRDAFAAPLSDTFEMVNESGADTVRHRLVKSASLTLSVNTREHIEDNYRKDLQEVRDQIRNLSAQQDLTNQQTKAIQKAAQDSGTTTPQQKQQLAELASQQASEAQRAMAIESRAEQIRQSMQINRMQEGELGKMAQDVTSGMTEVGQNDMPRAAGELSKAQDAAGKTSPKKDSDKTPAEKQADKQAADDTAKASANAARQQEMALATMQRLIDELGAAGDFEAHRAKLAEILDQQKKLENALREAAAKTFGKELSELSKEERAAVEQIAKEQAALARETADLTEKMEKTADQLSRSDPASSESLKKAAEASRSNDVPGSQGKASSAAGQNQTSSASNEMTAARKGLEQMMDELDQQSKRQLEQLARQLQDLLDALQMIKTKQVAIKDETVKAGAVAVAEMLRPLGDRQGRLQGNTLAEAKRAESMRNAKDAAVDIHDAADAMGSAATELYKIAQPASLPPQDDALTALDKAIAKLQKQKQDVENQLKDENLASIRKQYEEIKKGQEDIKKVADDLGTKKETRGELAREDSMALGAEATAQGKLIEQVDKLSKHPELSKYDVLVWINSLVNEQMAESKRRLASEQTGKQLATIQQAALDRLQEIIDALKEEQGKKSEFAGGGGGGGGGKPPLIPPATQLKLLKSQQQIVNTGTKETNQQIETAANNAEKNRLQQQAEQLGEKQSKIKDLATKVVEQLKGPSGP